MAQKHYVYSARTTEKGLALLNKTKGEMSWDQFINDAVAAHYKLDADIVALPPSKFLEEQKAKRDAKATAKAEAKAAREKAAADKKAEKAAAKKAPATGSKKADKKAAETKAADAKADKKGGKKGTTKKGATKAAKPAKVTAPPAEETGTTEAVE